MAEIRNLTRNGETFYPLTCTDAVLNRDGEPLGLINDIFDISEYNASGTPPVLAKYASLSLALAAVPTSKQKGGMTIRYVQSSDNKYVQYRLMSDTFNTTVANWQGVDDEPTVGSNNLIKSGGVFIDTMSDEYDVVNSDKFSIVQGSIVLATSQLDRMSIKNRINTENINSVKVEFRPIGSYVAYQFSISGYNSNNEKILDSGWVDGGKTISLNSTIKSIYIVFRKENDGNILISDLNIINPILYFNGDFNYKKLSSEIHDEALCLSKENTIKPYSICNANVLSNIISRSSNRVGGVYDVSCATGINVVKNTGYKFLYYLLSDNVSLYVGEDLTALMVNKKDSWIPDTETELIIPDDVKAIYIVIGKTDDGIVNSTDLNNAVVVKAKGFNHILPNILTKEFENNFYLTQNNTRAWYYIDFKNISSLSVRTNKDSQYQIAYSILSGETVLESGNWGGIYKHYK